MQVAFYIGVGGAAGALLRYGLNCTMQYMLGPATLLGTLLANVLGSFCIGMLYVGTGAGTGADTDSGWMSAPLREGLAIGLLGSFTTFSAFSLQTQLLLREGERLHALLYVLLSITLCLVACWIGTQLPRTPFRLA